MTAVEVNSRQQEALSGVVAYLTENYARKREVKSLVVDNGEVWNGSHVWHGVSVKLTVGLVGDEGTLAEYLGRDSYTFFIGPRGGIFYCPIDSQNIRRIGVHDIHRARW